MTNPLAAFASALTSDRKLVQPEPVPAEQADAVLEVRKQLAATTTKGEEVDG